MIIALIAGLVVGCAPQTSEVSETSEVWTPSPPIPATLPPTPQGSPALRTPSPTPTAAPELAAVVNGQPILLADYQKQVAQFEAALLDQGLDPESEEGRAVLAQMRLQVLDSMIEQALIEQAAAREGVAVSEEELEAAIRKNVEEAGGREAFEGWLRGVGLTYEEFREALRSQMLASAMFERVTASVPTTAEHVHARHILVATEEEAQAILARLRAGEDFATLARECSLDENTRESGGDLGFFPRGLLIAPEVEEAAFALSPGQISGVVHSQFGYHIVQVLEKDPDRPLAPEVRADLRERAFRRWLEEQWEGAAIERFVDIPSPPTPLSKPGEGSP